MRGDNSLLIIGSQLINVRRMMELEHYHLATSIIIFFFLFGLAMWFVEFYFPNQGLNRGLLQ